MLCFVVDIVSWQYSANYKKTEIYLLSISFSCSWSAVCNGYSLESTGKTRLWGLRSSFSTSCSKHKPFIFSDSLFWNPSRSVFVSLLQLCSAEEWPWRQWHHTKRLAWPWPEPLLAPLVRLNGGWFHSSLTHYGLLQSLSQICGWNVGKYNYACCTWCWLLTKD